MKVRSLFCKSHDSRNGTRLGEIGSAEADVRWFVAFCVDDRWIPSCGQVLSTSRDLDVIGFQSNNLTLVRLE